MASYPDQVRAAERAAIRKRYRRGRRAVGMAALRVAELNREFTDRYGSEEIPNDDAGRDDVTIMLHHLARRTGYPAQRMAEWLAWRAPWLQGDDRDELVARILVNPIKFKADTLARKIGLTAARRARLAIRTIGAIDEPAEQRHEARRIAKLERKRQQRRAEGRRLRADVVAASVNRQQPWTAQGISRSTYFRRVRLRLDETSVAPV